MLCFLSDYTEGAHPKVLAHLMERNLVSLPGYGEDADTEAAKEKIRRECGRDDLQICFLTGGTQTKPHRHLLHAQKLRGRGLR